MSPPPRFFARATDFRAWLTQHAASTPELVVGFWKVNSGRPSMSWPESVDEALCVGWIDGVRQRLDDAAYRIRFTPRRPGSVWSAINIAKAQALIEAGRMQPAGLAAFQARRDDRSVIYAYEQADIAQLSADEQARFQAHTTAWAYFSACPPGYRKTLLHWVTTARQPATRARRLDTLIQACARQERLR
ncbi:YdeI/OmpD-associated family protein [Ideonella sp. 4Y11]|uniref:YdeI/OmpD-associated family protein n=1 Tax=Ideonella aquatica TaxID=2824119 RepID=A0A940YS33_9BURK|nr:YdeI/OmpD-associated family protein [Ideonella aquatica]MBQ0961852.1 YdeI/OmpD-associated family protein [Ideonella aquatica]